jgi:hypothetical protein
MKSMVMSFVTLLCAGALTACGVSTIGSGDEPGKGGSAGELSMGGSGVLPGTAGKGGKGPGMGGTGTAGSDPGTGGTSRGECVNDMDCAVDLTCHLCPDGNEICSKAVCLPEGKCARQEPICSNIIKCDTNTDCPVLDIACKDCGDGTQACPTAECIMGICQNAFAGCVNQPGPCDELSCGEACGSDAMLFCNEMQQCQPEKPTNCAAECKTAMDCGPVDGKCVLCDDGTCAKVDCVNGACQQSCESTGQACKQFEDCPVFGDVCFTCPGTNQCAIQACVHNSCQMVCPVE